MSKKRYKKDNPAFKHGKFCTPRYCIGCRKELGWKSNSTSIRCRSCAKKGILNGMKGNTYIMSKNHKKNLSLNHADFSGKNHWNWKGGICKKIYHCKEKKCNNIIGYPTWRKGKGRCLTCSNRGIYNSRFGKTIKPNWGKYKRINMRSSWEIRFAQFLDLSGYKWQYESKTFDLEDTTYTPDFYIPQWDLYIEIKGYFSDKAKIKLKKFKKLYKKIHLIIINELKYKEIIGIKK